MKCPSCVAAEPVHDTRDMPYTYKGESTIIPAVTGDFYPASDAAVAMTSTIAAAVVQRIVIPGKEFSNREGNGLASSSGHRTFRKMNASM